MEKTQSFGLFLMYLCAFAVMTLFEKTKPISGYLNGRNVNYNKGIWMENTILALKKQSQNKPNLVQLPDLLWGLKKQSQFQRKVKVKKQKVKMRVSPELIRRGDLKKQSQFMGQSNQRNHSNDNGLWRFWQMKAAKKQTQFKANLYFSPRRTPGSQSEQQRKPSRRLIS